MNDSHKDLLSTAHKIIAFKDSYLSLQEELLKITGADICSCFLSEGKIGDLQVSFRNTIGSDKVKEYLGNLSGKLSYSSKKKTEKILSIRQLWKINGLEKRFFAAVLGASERLMGQLSQKNYYLAVKINSSVERLESYPSFNESVCKEHIVIKDINDVSFQGKISSDQVFASFLKDRNTITDIINTSEFHLLPPYPFSVISIPLGFTYSTNFQEREVISIGIAWLGKNNAFAIDLDITVIEQAIQLCRCVAHEIITEAIRPPDVLNLLWDVDSLVSNAGLTPREREALELILQGYDEAQIKRYFAPCKKTNRPGINANSVTQLLQKLRDKIKSHLQGNEETRRKLEEQSITLKSFPTSLVKRALMCSEYYRGHQ